jgi:hypothetical protein
MDGQTRETLTKFVDDLDWYLRALKREIGTGDMEHIRMYLDGLAHDAQYVNREVNPNGSR